MEESVRISSKIFSEIKKRKFPKPTHVFLTGHSLGGAVAALTERLFPLGLTSTCIFGSPRYCNLAAYYCAAQDPPTQIQRVGDIVPAVPPKQMGYADHPYQFDTSGEFVLKPIGNFEWSHLRWCAALFFGKGLVPHNMELYRKELGEPAGSKSCKEILVSYEKVKV